MERRRPERKKIPEETRPAAETKVVAGPAVEQTLAQPERSPYEQAEIQRLEESLHATEPKPKRPLTADFADTPVGPDGTIEPSPEERADINRQTAKLASDYRWSPPSIFQGALTATNYDSRARNFSTRTRILTLENGKRAFAIYNYPLSWIHRLTDGLAKKIGGHRRKKVRSQDWKRTFESRSRIPVIRHADPSTVLLPFIPNINAYDLFTRNREMIDPGELAWATSLDAKGKLEIAEKIMQAVATIHATDDAWGETIIQNIIITADQQPIIVDPETQFDDDVALEDRQAMDVKDVIFSIVGAVKKSEQGEDIANIVRRLLEKYPRPEIVARLHQLVDPQPSWLKRFRLQRYELGYYGISLDEYQAISRAILEFIGSP